jgi:2-polyprenyl-6-hydroxyphenyl methylase/3-demethylubiquinone-9 3-methyltransferase
MNKNVDEQEVAKFSELAQQWWQLDGPQALLHIINPVRVNFIVRNLRQQNANILDVGCGGGILAESLAKLGHKVVAIDASAQLIAVAQEHADVHQLNIAYQHILLEDFITHSNKKFELITCMELLEHVPNPAQFIAHLASLLKPGGKLIVSTINRTLLAYLGTIIFAEHIANLLDKGTHLYEKFIQPAELNKFCEAGDLLLEKIHGIAYNPITKQASLTDNCQINYICLITKP